jgi:hypothetical protein
MLAEALYEAAIKRWPKAPILLRKAAWSFATTADCGW